MDKDILYIWLNKIKGIGPILANNLLNYFGNIEEVYISTVDELLKVEGIGEKLAKGIMESKKLDSSKMIFENCIKSNIQIITKYSDDYPSVLLSQPKAPLILYVKGILKEFDESVAIVGARRCNEYGKRVTVELAESLSANKIPIISGMAKGIDSYAHTVALNNDNYTIAVLGTGVDKCYPSEHINLMNKIIEKGAVISQFEPGTSNVKENFLKRNELIAMLSNKIVVVQASKDSGSLYTAKCGMKFNKEVYAVPSIIYDKFSEGSNMLINNGAKVYLSTESIVNKVTIVTNSVNISDIETKVINIVKNKPISIDIVIRMLGLTPQRVEELITEMELKGVIIQVGGLIKQAR